MFQDSYASVVESLMYAKVSQTRVFEKPRKCPLASGEIKFSINEGY